jgi:hypothetical protein
MFREWLLIISQVWGLGERREPPLEILGVAVDDVTLDPPRDDCGDLDVERVELLAKRLRHGEHSRLRPLH